MNAPAITRTQRRAAQMREAIIDSAQKLLAEKGPEALTSERVAAVADVSTQTVYNRVGGKAALLIAIAERALEENRRYMDAAYDGKGTAIERINKAGDAYVRFAFERPHAFQVLAHPPDEPEALERINRIVAEQNGKLAAALRDGQAEGTVNRSLNSALTATTLWAMLNGVLAISLRPREHGVDPRIVDELIVQARDVLSDGLRSRS